MEHDDNTVFVRNIAFTVDESKLSSLFSEVGPVRKVILVRPRGSENHKGFGFVNFSLREDAVKAASDLAGKKVDGRPLQVSTCELSACMLLSSASWPKLFPHV